MSEDRILVVVVDLPETVYAVAAPNSDGTYTGYINANIADEAHKRAVRNWVMSLEQAARPGEEAAV